MADVYQDKLDILFAKYRYSTNILKVLEILADPAQDTRDVEDWFLANLSIDGGEGVFLDFFGELIGVLRPPIQEPDILTLCGDWEQADDPFNRGGLSPDTLDEGGYLTGPFGVIHKTTSDEVADETYREFIRSKSTTFRRSATRAILYNYLSFFGCRWKILETAPRVVEFEPYDYAQINYYLRGYIENMGFRPAGIKCIVKNQTTPSSEV